MPFDFKLPDIGEGLHEGTLVEWLVAVGDDVAIDQPFCRLETDKAVVEIPAPHAGKVTALLFEEGAVITVGQVMISFDIGKDVASPADEPVEIDAGGLADDASEQAASEDDEGAAIVSDEEMTNRISRAELFAAQAAAARRVERKDPDADDDEILTSAPLHMVDSSAVADRPLATPHTRALARRLGVDLERVTATGPRGRITDADVERAAERSGEPTDEFLVDDLPPVPAATVKRPRRPRRRATALVRPNRPVARGESSLPPAALRVETQHDDESLTPVPQVGALVAAETEERVPVTHLRRVIADAMVHSRRTAAHVTHIDDADVTDLLRFHSRAKDRVAENGQKLTLLPYFIKAIVSALKNHPMLNATYDEAHQEIVIKRYYHLGVAVDTPQGLMVPVLRHADKKDILTIAAELEDMAFRARERRLDVDELRGASFTVSSLGSMGGAFATPIIHQPELAIIGLHAIKDRPAVVDGEVLARKMMFVSLSYDHRIIDGSVAAHFMGELIDLIQNPDLLMLRL